MHINVLNLDTVTDVIPLFAQQLSLQICNSFVIIALYNYFFCDYNIKFILDFNFGGILH